jgi:hypothetical protein
MLMVKKQLAIVLGIYSFGRNANKRKQNKRDPERGK